VGDELAGLDATAQAELIRSGAACAKEVVEAAIARIEALNPVLNAVIVPLFDHGRAMAGQVAAGGSGSDGPFAGVPFLLKDLGANQAGLPQYQGNRVLRDLDWRSSSDTPLGAAFSAAGLVTLGKTNVPEFGPHPTTQPQAFGPARNPWAPDNTPGGSSGGSAAAVAAGLVPLAHANDGGGSIRIPASWCGLVGLKPTRGLVASPEQINRYGVELAVTRTVRDTAAVLDAVHGNVPGELFRAPVPRRPYREEVGADPGRLRIGLLVDGGGVEIDSECVVAARDTALLLESLGHHVEEAASPLLFDDLVRQASRDTWAAGGVSSYQAFSRLIGRQPEADDVEPYTWASWRWARQIPLERYLAASTAQQQWAVEVSKWWHPGGDGDGDGYDLLLTPTTGEPAPPIAELDPDPEQPWRINRRYGRIARFTMPFNVTGHPAITLPLHLTAGRPPVGSQLVADHFREDVLLRVAAQLESAAPWGGRRPPIHA
jgi:amidase